MLSTEEISSLFYLQNSARQGAAKAARPSTTQGTPAADRQLLQSSAFAAIERCRQPRRPGTADSATLMTSRTSRSNCLQHGQLRGGSSSSSSSSSRNNNRQSPPATLLSRPYMFNPHVRMRSDGTIDRGSLTVSSQVFSATFPPSTGRSSPSVGRFAKGDVTGATDSKKWAFSPGKSPPKSPEDNSMDLYGRGGMKTPAHKSRKNLRERPASSRRLGFPTEITQIGLRQK